MRMAIPAGRLEAPSWNWLQRRGVSRGAPHGRRLWTQAGGLEVVLVRGRDIPGLVTAGVVDMAILGRDVAEESGAALWSSAGLGFGMCRLMLAVPDGVVWDPARPWRIATRYPRLTRRWLEDQRVDAQVTTLTGSVEVAPRLGLADAVVDVVQTGETLRANGLQAVASVLDCCAVLVTRSGEQTQALGLLDQKEAEARAVGDTQAG